MVYHGGLCLPGLPWGSVLAWLSTYLVFHRGSVLTWLPTYLVCHRGSAYLVTHLPSLSQGVCAYLVTHLPGLSWGGGLCLPGHPLTWLVTGVSAYLVCHWGSVLTWLPTYLFGMGGLCLPGYPLTWFVMVPVLASCRVALCSGTTWSPTACWSSLRRPTWCTQPSRPPPSPTSSCMWSSVRRRTSGSCSSPAQSTTDPLMSECWSLRSSYTPSLVHDIPSLVHYNLYQQVSVCKREQQLKSLVIYTHDALVLLIPALAVLHWFFAVLHWSCPCHFTSIPCHFTWIPALAVLHWFIVLHVDSCPCHFTSIPYCFTLIPYVLHWFLPLLFTLIPHCFTLIPALAVLHRFLAVLHWFLPLQFYIASLWFYIDSLLCVILLIAVFFQTPQNNGWRVCCAAVQQRWHLLLHGRTWSVWSRQVGANLGSEVYNFTEWIEKKNRRLLCDRLCTVPEIFLESNSMQTTKVLWMRLQTEVPLVYTHAKKITYAC